MAEVLTGINGAIIKWAREYYNMSIEDAAVLIGVDIACAKAPTQGTAGI